MVLKRKLNVSADIKTHARFVLSLKVQHHCLEYFTDRKQ